MSKSTKEILTRLAIETKEAQAKKEAENLAARIAEETKKQNVAKAEATAEAFFALALAPLESAVRDFNEVNIVGASISLLEVKRHNIRNLKYTDDFQGAQVEFTWRAGIVIEFKDAPNRIDAWRLGFTALVDPSTNRTMVAACYTRSSTAERTVNGFFDPSSGDGTVKWADQQIDEMLEHVKLY